MEGGWLEVSYEPSRDAVLAMMGESIRRRPALRSGVAQGGELRAAVDLKRSPTDRAAQVLTLINPPAWVRLASTIKALMAK